MNEQLTVALIAILIVALLIGIALVIARGFFGVSLGRKAPRRPGQTVDSKAPVQYSDDHSGHGGTEN